MDFFYRKIYASLQQWKNIQHRKPLVLRGARQTGKTSTVKAFARTFNQFLYFNLEKREERDLFEQDYVFADLVKALFFFKDAQRNNGETLIFIDEIQNSQAAVSLLRYFYEEAPDIYVVAAGSFMETLINKRIHFPVGRVEYKAQHPLNYEEFLAAMGYERALQLIREQVPAPDYVHEKLTRLYRDYMIVGGMPEVVKYYAETDDLTGLAPIYAGLLTTYMDDIEKYARNDTMVSVIRHAMQQIFQYPAERIVFEGFGYSSYKYREMNEAFQDLQKAMLLQLVYPVVNQKLPAHANFKKRPKLQLLDTGITGFYSGVQKDLFRAASIDQVFGGRMAEHIVGQELKALSESVLFQLHFWTRQAKNSQAEVDFVYPYEGMLIPIEVKNSKKGRLRSLHLFMDQTPHPYAVRIYSGKLAVDEARTPAGNIYYLLNLPFYLVNQLDNYLQWIMGQS